MTTYVERAPARQITGVLAVVAIHAALILALTSGLASRLVPLPEPPVIQWFDVPTTTPTPKPEPIERPDSLTPADPVVPVPDPIIELEDPPVELDLPPPVELAPPSSGGTIHAPSPLRVDPRHALTKPDYPAMSIRLNEEGRVLLLIYVLPDGSVGDVKVSRSSGYSRLDASAMREAKRSWRFLPAKSGSGQAIPAWGTFEVTFQLDN